MQLVDSHAHLDHLDDLDGALERAKDTGVGKIITVGTTIAESKNVVKLALLCSRPRRRQGFGGQAGLDKYTTGLEVYATVGIHPKDGKEDVEKLGVNESIHRLRKIAKASEKVVAIGECGLDYYSRDTGHETSNKEKEFQRELFEAQVKLAAELNLPLVVHCRNGWSEIFDLISKSIGSSHSRGSENQILKQVFDREFQKTSAQTESVENDREKVLFGSLD